MGLDGDIPPDVPEAGVSGGDVGATGGAAKQAGDSQPEWRKYYPNVELGPVATGNGRKREFKNSLESEIQAHAQAKKVEQAQMGYGNVPQFGWVNHSTLPGEAARRDMNDEKNWSTHRDESGDQELFSKKGWHLNGLKQWVSSPEFDKNQTDRAKGELAATDSEKFGKQVKSLMFDNAKGARQKDERMSGYYTDPYTGLPMPILNEHSSELDKAGATFRDFILKRNPGVRTWSAMKDLSRYQHTEDPRDLESFYQKWAENAMDAAMMDVFVPEAMGTGVGRLAGAGEYWQKTPRFYEGLQPMPPRGPGMVGQVSGAAQRNLAEMIERLSHRESMDPGVGEGIYGADVMASRLRASAMLKEKLTAENLERLAGKLSYPSPKNGAHFWSGGPPARAAAEAEARRTGGVTLEMTPNGEMFDRMRLWDGMDRPTKTDAEARAVFKPASRRFAESADGTVHAHLAEKLNSDSMWLNTEEPILIKKNPIVKRPVGGPRE